ncbi:MAG TPA: acyl-protein synthetase [Polyangiaceae bacterium]|nr:acyl-protein synthetase [Polyangiaceae bacterium]
MDLVERSEELHAKVRAFAGDDFAALALELAEFQARFSPGFARLVKARGAALDTLASIPAVPTDAFRLTRVAVHPPELDRTAFFTSGTTGSARGTHYFRTLDTYKTLALRDGARGLEVEAPLTVACLATPASSSSLGTMMAWFHEAWDGGEPRWLVDGDAIDVAELRRAAELGKPLLLLATAFALVALLDRLAGERIATPAGSKVMMTGGFKGRIREVESETLRAQVAESLGLEPGNVIGEYGMTELTSQFYEASPGTYVDSPTIRVYAVDGATLEPVGDGEIGLGRIVDLGNVDSAVAIQTQDRVRRVAGGFELLGRAPASSRAAWLLALESLLG